MLKTKIGIWLALLGVCICTIAVSSQAQLDESLLSWKPERGITLNGITEYYEVTDASDFNVEQLTVEAWFNLRDNSGRQQIAGRGSAGQYFTFYADNGNGRFLIEDVDVGHESAISDVPPANTWVHMAGVYDGEFVRLYYNGILVAETEWAATMRQGEDPLRIGALSAGERHVNGMIENLRIWKRGLSADELEDLLATEPENENLDEMKANGLISYWASRSLDGKTLQDLAGDNDATYQKFTLDQSNLNFMPEEGISFDGQSTYVEIEDGTPFNLHAFSLETWVRFDRTHENQVFMNRGGAPQDFTFYLFDRIRFLVQDVSSYSHANGPVPPANEWVHIVGTHGEDGTKRLYYNGILQMETTVPSQPLDSNNPLYLGALEPGSRHLDGVMENMRIWNKELSEEEILDLLETKPAEEDIEEMKKNGLIAYWASRSIEGDQLIDLTGNGNDGVFGAFEVDESHLAFKPEEGLLFDGASTFASFDNPALFEIDFITLEAWVYLDPIFHDRTLSARGIVGRGGTDEYFGLDGDSHFGNRIHMRIGEFGDAAAPMPPAEQWVHVCGTFDFDKGIINLYYNGVLVDSDQDALGVIPWGDAPLHVGSLSPEGGFFQGAMENVRIWNRALEEQEIRELLATPPAEENVDQMVQDGLLIYYTSGAVEDGTLIDYSGNGYDAEYSGSAGPVRVSEWSLY